MTAGPLNETTPPATRRDEATQTTEDLAYHNAKILITLGTSEEQRSHRFPALRVRPGECVAVAVSLIASMRPDQMTAPNLDKCSHEYQYRRYVPPRRSTSPTTGTATMGTSSTTQSPPKKPKREEATKPKREDVKHETDQGFTSHEVPGMAPTVTAEAQEKSNKMCVIVDWSGLARVVAKCSALVPRVTFLSLVAASVQPELLPSSMVVLHLPLNPGAPRIGGIAGPSPHEKWVLGCNTLKP